MCLLACSSQEEERLGADIVMKALKAPARIIAENAGSEGEVVINKVLGQPFEIGYNAMVDQVRGGAVVAAPVMVSGCACGVRASSAVRGLLGHTRGLRFAMACRYLMCGDKACRQAWPQCGTVHPMLLSQPFPNLAVLTHLAPALFPRCATFWRRA